MSVSIKGLVILLGVSLPSIAADINFSGYGSIRAGMLLNDNFIPPIYGYTDKVNFKNESLFALQASSQLNKDWNATILLQASGQDDFRIEAKWAYLSYAVTPEIQISTRQ